MRIKKLKTELGSQYEIIERDELQALQQAKAKLDAVPAVDDYRKPETGFRFTWRFVVVAMLVHALAGLALAWHIITHKN